MHISQWSHRGGRGQSARVHTSYSMHSVNVWRVIRRRLECLKEGRLGTEKSHACTCNMPVFRVWFLPCYMALVSLMERRFHKQEELLSPNARSLSLVFLHDPRKWWYSHFSRPLKSLWLHSHWHFHHAHFKKVWLCINLYASKVVANNKSGIRKGPNA